ncbi:hypothetical protein HN873_013289, partial [Arachis hypogaea]
MYGDYSGNTKPVMEQCIWRWKPVHFQCRCSGSRRDRLNDHFFPAFYDKIIRYQKQLKKLFSHRPTREDVLKNIRNPPGEIIIIVATVSLPWNNVFGGENLPTFLVGAVAAAVSSMAIFCCLLRHNHTQSEAAKKAVLPL